MTHLLPSTTFQSHLLNYTRTESLEIFQFVTKTNQVLVVELVKGGLADQLCIQPRDEVLYVNNSTDISGEDLYTKFQSSIGELFQCTDPHELTFELKRSPPNTLTQFIQQYVIYQYVKCIPIESPALIMVSLVLSYTLS